MTVNLSSLFFPGDRSARSSSTPAPPTPAGTVEVAAPLQAAPHGSLALGTISRQFVENGLIIHVINDRIQFAARFR